MSAKVSINYKYKGRDLTLYYIGALSLQTGRATQTLRKWELAGILPKTPFKDSSGRRLYTQEHIDCVVKALDRYKIGQGKAITTSFKQALHKNFLEIFNSYSV